MSTQPLFGISSLDEAWETVAAGSDTPGYAEALRQLALYRTRLPAAVMFVASKEFEAERYEELLRGSTPACVCSRRRFIMPGQSREPHEMIRSDPMVLGAGESIEVGPLGGDQMATHFRFEVSHDGMILITRGPYAPEPDDPITSLKRNFFVVTRPSRRADYETSLSTMNEVVDQYGENPFMIDYLGDRSLVVPAGTVTAVDPAQNTLTLCLSRAVVIVDRSNLPEPHVCATSA